ncbi:MAG: outer membrane beta-barrel protein [Bacteroidota bacterium]
MKKITLSALALLLTIVSFSQTDQGRILVGVGSNTSFSSTSIDGNDDNDNTFSIGLNGGYFIIDNLVAGASLSFLRNTQGDFSSNAFGIGPFVRGYYEMFFAEAGVSFFDNNAESDFGEFDSSGNQINFGLGYAAFINDYISVEPSLNYSIGGGDFDGINTFSLNVGFAIYLP